MSKLDAKMFNSITPFAKQWILGDEMYEFLYNYQAFLNDNYLIVKFSDLTWEFNGTRFLGRGIADLIKWYSETELPDMFVKENYTLAKRTEYDNNEISIGSAGGVVVKDNSCIKDTEAASLTAFLNKNANNYVIVRLADNMTKLRLYGTTWTDQTAGIYCRISGAVLPTDNTQVAQCIISPGYKTIAIITWNATVADYPDGKYCGISTGSWLNVYEPGLTAANADEKIGNSYLYYKKNS